MIKILHPEDLQSGAELVEYEFRVRSIVSESSIRQ